MSDIQDTNKRRCSFCGRSEDAVDKMLAGNNAYICSDCIEFGAQMLGLNMAVPEEPPHQQLDIKLYTRMKSSAFWTTISSAGQSQGCTERCGL